MAVRRNPPKIELLSRSGCHLCDDAARHARAVFGDRNVRIVDVTSDPLLEERFVFRIPVISFAGNPIVEGRIEREDARLARRRILRLHADGQVD
jgi:hypothetical protein